MHIERLFESNLGKIFLSIILGLGLSGLFNKECDDETENCIIIRGPNEKKIKNTIYKYNNKCYQYEKKMLKCNNDRPIYDFSQKK
ncbi:hypothetical protein CL656_07085 [bacterium]|nr:hypothetical protein [bacterium]|tara:strand:+ start:353 stop:607 length:255 start_codon:yes stop_codon:yes gene_type:complete